MRHFLPKSAVSGLWMPYMSSVFALSFVRSTVSAAVVCMR